MVARGWWRGGGPCGSFKVARARSFFRWVGGRSGFVAERCTIEAVREGLGARRYFYGLLPRNSRIPRDRYWLRSGALAAIGRYSKTQTGVPTLTSERNSITSMLFIAMQPLVQSVPAACLSGLSLP